MRMIRSGKFADKKILLLDKAPKTSNDRTWCFWEAGDGFFEDIVYRKWPRVDFFSDTWNQTLEINPYSYKMIRGIDFYTRCFQEISRQPHIETVYGEIGHCVVTAEHTSLLLNGQEYIFPPAILFNSVYTPGHASLNVKQHFKGWVIETADPVFDQDKASLMDFRVHQDKGTSFAYVLPFSRNTALVEYTMFTPQLLEPDQYDAELRNYIKDFLKPGAYTVKEEEFGVIPMTNEKFSVWRDGVCHIGTAGGRTKASSGYTFQFVQRQSQEILERLLSGQSLSGLSNTPARFRFYDNTLLYILYHDTLPGREIFSTLFRKNKAAQVLKFLDNESSIGEELRIISSLPTWPFLKAAVKQLM